MLPLPAAAKCPDFEASFPGFTIGTSVAIVPASAIDETLTVPFLLATSCNTDIASARTKIFYTNPHPVGGGPPTLVKTVTTPDVSSFGWGSLALRGDRGDLLGCTSNSDQHHDIYRIDIKTGAATFLFTATAGDDICDGVAWDAATDTVYQSPDVADTIYYWKLDKTDAVLSSGSFPVPIDTGIGGPCPNSGLAVSGDSIWAGCNGNVRVEQIGKTSHTLVTSFPSGTQRTEDLECDPFSFPGKDVIWTKEAYLDEVFAFEIPRGTCNIAGTVPNPIPAPVPAGNCCPGPACCPPAGRVDTDGDGLLDCWEDNKGIDFDGNCTIDFNLANYPTASDNPDKNHKDLYVELDYMNGVTVSTTALDNIKTAFNAGNGLVMNPDGTTGVRFHYQVDEDVNGDPFANLTTEFVPCSGTDGSTSFDTWKATKFGTAAERAAGSATLNAKQLVFRYGLFVHQLAARPTTMGCAEVPGDDFVIAKDGFGSQAAFNNVANQAGVVFHEIGHNLGLRHGSISNVDFQPNHVSVMNDSLTLPNWQPARVLSFSPFKAVLNEAGGVDETTGIPQDVAGRHTLYWYSSTPSVAGTYSPFTVDTLNAVDINGGGLASGQTIVLRKDGLTPLNLGGGDDWTSLVLNFRLATDYAPAAHLSLLSNEEVPLTVYLEHVADTDSDGIDNIQDNCITVANPDQQDANANGIGDACEVKPTVCIIVPGDRSDLRAVFGYVNSDYPVTIPVGSNNTLTGATTIAVGAQPSVFAAGTRNDVFEVVFDHKKSVSWTLSGVTVTAAQHTQHCPK